MVEVVGQAVQVVVQVVLRVLSAAAGVGRQGGPSPALLRGSGER